MRKIALAGALAAVVACSQSDSTERQGAEAGKAPVTASSLQPGVYEYKRSDGLRGINTIAADGTFSDARSDGIVETGTWAEESGQACLTPDGEGAARRCYIFTRPNAAGAFTGTATDGATVEVRRID